ncbi:MAG: ABC transporter ATP-binding protein, partial [Proteobacteria bacterium]|nr:ABC transporter ATP-binding protein [Pseudomonadota bacterium]
YLDEAERCDRLALLHRGAMVHCDTPAGLKARMPGAMIEIMAADPRPLWEIVRTLPAVKEVLLVGTGVHAHVDDADRRLPEIAQALGAAGVAASRMARVSPSIEDLFVALLGLNGKRDR